MRLGQAISSLLAEYGVEQIFGIPGVHTLELFRDIDQSGLNVVIPRHEQGAGFMADAYSRVSGQPGVCYVITGPGVTNALTPVAQAWHDSVPLLVIASAVTRPELGVHRGTLHDTPDLAEVLRPFTLFSETATTVGRVRELIDEAFLRWATERPRPVYIGVPRDLLEEEVGTLHRPEPAAPARQADVRALEGPLDAAVAALSAAQRPLIIAGGGARNDRAAVTALAERMNAPVVLTGNAKGLLPSEHPLFAGVSLPFPRTLELVEAADLILALGTELSDFEVLFTGAAEPRMADIVRIDIDPHVTHPDQRRATIPLRVADFAAYSVSRLPARSGDDGAERAARARVGLAEARAADVYTPWIEAIARAVPADAIVALDSAQVAYQSQYHFDFDTPASWLAPYGFGTLGPALPMAIGAAVAAPGRPAIALAGDGGALFTLPELATARDLDLPVVVILWNNGGYREIEISFERVGIAPAGVRTTAHDLPLIAEGFGAAVDQPRTPEELEQAVRDALARGGLSVVVVQAPADLRVETDALTSDTRTPPAASAASTERRYQ